MTPIPRLDLEGLGPALWTSHVWVMALVDPELRVAAASSRLEEVVGHTLTGEPIVTIVAPTQQPAFLDGLRSAGSAWAELRLGLIRDGESLPVDYRVRLRKDADHLLVVGEPDVADGALVAEQLLEVTEDLISEQRKMSLDRHRLARLTTTDPLTTLSNRRGLEAELKRRLALADSSGSAVSVVFADIDHFKRINDDLGHAVGDVVLRFIADLLAATCRADDLVARYGGEEFVAVLPGTDLAGATRWAERARSAMAARHAPEVGRPVTASFGVATYRPGEIADRLLARADAALYAAKGAGRDRIAVAGPEGADPIVTRPPDPPAPESPDHPPRLSDILWESAGMGVAEFDAEDRLSSANPAFERLLGADITGRSLAELVAGPQVQAIDQFVAGAGADWARGRFGLAATREALPLDRVLWLRRGAAGLDLIVDVDPDLPEQTQAPLLGLIDDLVATQRALSTSNRKLQQALDQVAASSQEVRKLRALVPICAWCRRIRVDGTQGPDWLSLESFLEREEVQVTHAMCADCLARESNTVSQA